MGCEARRSGPTPIKVAARLHWVLIPADVFEQGDAERVPAGENPAAALRGFAKAAGGPRRVFGQASGDFLGGSGAVLVPAEVGAVGHVVDLGADHELTVIEPSGGVGDLFEQPALVDRSRDDRRRSACVLCLATASARWGGTRPCSLRMPWVKRVQPGDQLAGVGLRAGGFLGVALVGQASGVAARHGMMLRLVARVAQVNRAKTAAARLCISPSIILPRRRSYHSF